MEDRRLKARILEISYKHKLSHIGSCLTAVDILDRIYRDKGTFDEVVLSSGHAGLALYVVLEKYIDNVNAEELYKKHGVHPHKDEDIPCSTGSLGQGLPIAVGMAMASNHKVHCVISDGECAEGSIWEALAFIEQNNVNIDVHVNMNGVCAYDTIDCLYLSKRLESFLPRIQIYNTKVNQYHFLRGINAHYHVMSEEDYKSTL